VNVRANPQLETTLPGRRPFRESCRSDRSRPLVPGGWAGCGRSLASALNACSTDDPSGSPAVRRPGATRGGAQLRRQAGAWRGLDRGHADGRAPAPAGVAGAGCGWSLSDAVTRRDPGVGFVGRLGWVLWVGVGVALACPAGEAGRACPVVELDALCGEHAGLLRQLASGECVSVDRGMVVMPAKAARLCSARSNRGAELEEVWRVRDEVGRGMAWRPETCVSLETAEARAAAEALAQTMDPR